MDIDINFIRSAATVLAFAGFIGIWVWAWSRKRAADFDQAARLPFEQD